MRLATRTFLWSLLPFAILLACSFWAVETLVLSAVREDLRSTVKETQKSIRQMGSKAEQGNRRVLRIVAENPALKAGVQLLLERTRDAEARRTVEDQLLEICDELKFDFMLVSDTESQPLAAVIRKGGRLETLDLRKVGKERQGYFSFENLTYQVTSVPIDQAGENLGNLSVGEQYDSPAVPVPAILVHNGKIVSSKDVDIRFEDIESGLRNCPSVAAECDMRLKDAQGNQESYISIPMDSLPMDSLPMDSAPLNNSVAADEYHLRSLQSVDDATRPIQSILRGVFLLTGFGALAGAVLVSVLSSRSIVKPITGVIAHLRESARTGELAEFQDPGLSGPGLHGGGLFGQGLFRQGLFGKDERIHEISELTRNFNRASAAIRDAHGRLQQANVEVIESLTSALDARDPYTAGHSRRVSQYACAIAGATGLSRDEINEVRIGALLHDVGKIGVSDSILLKPGKLTPEENALIQEHPSIGRRILEGVHGLQPYLAVVELHHENWDGTGYPHGLRGEETPVTARIVKIADAYDAMTSDRPYRQGMSHEKALSVFEQIAGTQLDPSIVEVLRRLQPLELRANISETKTESLRRLSEAVGSSPRMPVSHVHEGKS